MEDQDKSKMMVIMKVYAIKSIFLSGRSSRSILSSLVMFFFPKLAAKDRQPPTANEDYACTHNVILKISL